MQKAPLEGLPKRPAQTEQELREAVAKQVSEHSWSYWQKQDGAWAKEQLKAMEVPPGSSRVLLPMIGLQAQVCHPKPKPEPGTEGSWSSEREDGWPSC